MTRILVNDRTPQFIIPTIRTDIPMPKASKGRPCKPLNPSLFAMPAGSSFVVTGAETVKTILADLGRIRKAHPEAVFKTRNLSGAANPSTFETYPEHTLGVWCTVAVGAGADSVGLDGTTLIGTEVLE